MDISFIFKIAAIGIIVAVLNMVLIRSGREEQAMLTTLAGVIVVLMMIIPLLGMLVLYVGMIYASLMFIISYIDLADISSDKKGYALLISFVLTIVAVAIVASMAASMVGSSISNSLGGYSSYDSYSDWDF